MIYTDGTPTVASAGVRAPEAPPAERRMRVNGRRHDDVTILPAANHYVLIRGKRIIAEGGPLEIGRALARMRDAS